MIRQPCNRFAPHNKFVLFGLCKSPILMWMETGIVHIKTFIKYYFFRLSRLLLKSFHILAFRSVQEMWFCQQRSGDVVLPVVIDNFMVLFVNVYPLFIVNIGLALVNLNKETLHLWISGDHVSALFFGTSSFSFFGFSLQRRKKTFPNLLSKSHQRKENQSNVQTCAVNSDI